LARRWLAALCGTSVYWHGFANKHAVRSIVSCPAAASELPTVVKSLLSKAMCLRKVPVELVGKGDLCTGVAIECPVLGPRIRGRAQPAWERWRSRRARGAFLSRRDCLVRTCRGREMRRRSSSASWRKRVFLVRCIKVSAATRIPDVEGK
jgi:hypothetical protein